MKRTMKIIMSNVIIDKDTDCWNWKGTIVPSGHGQLRVTYDGHKFQRAHRVAYYLYYGELPEVCCHKCNNARCCNPLHLYSGNQQDNMNDRAQDNLEKQRISPTAYLDAQQVREIRAFMASKEYTIAQLSKMYNVPAHTIRQIHLRKLYKGVPE